MPARLSADDRENLADARTLLSTAEHNVLAALQPAPLVEPSDALDAAIRMASQALTALERVRGSLRQRA